MFRFGLEDYVQISCSGEEGIIIGRADYLDIDDSYWVRYKNAAGIAVETWWPDSALEPIKY